MTRCRPTSRPPRPRCGAPLLSYATGLILGCALLLPASAATLHVDGVSGADGGGCGTPQAPCATIQQAVDLASSGDTILVGEAVYVDDVACLGEAAVVCVFQKQLTILGGYASGEWSSPDPSTHVTVIDGQDVRRGLLVRRGGPDPGLPATGLVLQGFTVRRGRAVGNPQGVGGGLKANFADVTLRDMVFDDNLAIGGSGGLGGGGGVAVLSDRDNLSGVVLERVAFTANQATGGGGSGGVGIGGGLLLDHAVVDGSNLRFDGNAATGGSSGTAGRDGLGGAAAFSFGSTGTLRALTATDNTAAGGAASATGGGAFGGAIFMEGGDGGAAAVTDLTLLDADVSGNAAQGGDAGTAGGGVGGGIDVFGARLTLARGVIVGNSAEGGTGSSSAGNAGGGGIFIEWPFAAAAPLNEVRNSVVADNVIDGSQGGGGGLRLLGARARVEHTTIVDNRLLGAGFGLGILVGPRFASSKPSVLDLDYSIVADHTVPSSGRALHVQSNAQVSSTADLRNRSHFVGNSHHTNSGEINSGTYLGYPGDNVLDAAASDFFIDPATSDYHVDGTQPPTDAAVGSSEPLDLDGAARSGTRDLGADEFGAAAHALTVGKLGAGSGMVTSSPAGVDCGGDCFELFAAGSAVVLDAEPAADSHFAGWSGDLDCSDGSLTLSQDRQCLARFDLGPSPCSAAADDLTLTSGQTVNGTTTESACNSITAGPYTVGSSGDVTFRAPTIVLRNGFVVRGIFTASNQVP
jgi:hypothetical protein